MFENIDIFQGLTQNELETVAGIARQVSFKRGEIIFHQGDSFQDFFIIESGQVEISYTDAFQVKRVLSVLRTHDFFGEMALFDQDAIRSATAKALQPTSVIIISGKDFEGLLKEKTSISFKLLGALSRRLRDSNFKVASTVLGSKSKEGKIITIASAKSGYGKTVFATTFSHLLANEISKSILFLDLDLYFGDGTYYMGVSSPKSIMDFALALRKDPFPDREEVFKNLVKVCDNLFLLPATHSFLDAEQVEAGSLVAILKNLKRHFDYLILDTESTINDFFLNALEMSDFIFLLADAATPLSLRNNSRYFQAISKLNLPSERINLLVTKTPDDFNPERVGVFFKNDIKYRTLGSLPILKNPPLDYGKNCYHASTDSFFCGVLRLIAKNILKEEPRAQKEGNFLHRLFSKYNPSENLLADNLYIGESSGSLLKTRISEKSISALFNYIRMRMNFGFLEESKLELLHILEFCPKSSMGYQCLGETLLAENNLSDAISAFTKALEFNPRSHIAMGYLGHLTSNEEIFSKALEILKTEMESHPQYSDLQRDMGKLLLTKGRAQESLPYFQKAIKINPVFLEARVDLAINLWELGQMENSVRELISTSPKTLRIYYLLGKFLYLMGKFPEARDAFNLAAEFKADYLDIQEKLDSLQEYFQKISVLTQKIQNFSNEFPNFPDVHLQLGELYLAGGDYQKAQKEFEMAVRQKKDYSEAQNRLEELRRAPSFQVLPEIEENGSFVKGPKKDFLLKLDLKKLLNTPGVGVKKNETLKIVVSNSRTGKEIISSFTPHDLKSHAISLDCARLGDIFEQDALLVQAIEPSDKKVLTNLCHVVSKEELMSGSGNDAFQ